MSQVRAERNGYRPLQQSDHALPADRLQLFLDTLRPRATAIGLQDGHFETMVQRIGEVLSPTSRSTIVVEAVGINVISRHSAGFRHIKMEEIPLHPFILDPVAEEDIGQGIIQVSEMFVIELRDGQGVVHHTKGEMLLTPSQQLCLTRSDLSPTDPAFIEAFSFAAVEHVVREEGRIKKHES